MLLTKSDKFNANYASKIVEINNFVKHPNPNCTRMKCAVIDGYSISVSIDTPEGIYIYFPVGSEISNTYLSANNLFRNKDYNADKEKSGFFEDNGRVKMIKLQGEYSEGFIMPISSLDAWLGKPFGTAKVGEEFDTVDGKRLSSKFIVKGPKINAVNPNGKQRKRKVKEIDRVIEDQFRFHYDTTLIKKCPYVIKPDSLISITEKVHGTSGISSNVLCKKLIPWHSRFGAFMFNAWDKIVSLFSKNNYNFELNEEEYADLWASRTVIKNGKINKDVTPGYYGVDVWKYAHDVIKPFLTKGLTAYYEIIGYLPNGGLIQKGYDYKYKQPENGVYKYNENFGIRIYRVTYTNPDGKVYEFSAKQVQDWAEGNNLVPVKEMYYGYAKDLYPYLVRSNSDQTFGDLFISALAIDKNFYMELDSPNCFNKVPHEGVVIKIEDSRSRAFKLKCLRFLDKESRLLDAGESDIESEA